MKNSIVLAVAISMSPVAVAKHPCDAVADVALEIFNARYKEIPRETMIAGYEEAFKSEPAVAKYWVRMINNAYDLPWKQKGVPPMDKRDWQKTEFIYDVSAECNEVLR